MPDMSEVAPSHRDSYCKPWDVRNAVFAGSLRIVEGAAAYSSKVVVARPFSRGNVIANFKDTSVIGPKAWTSLQVGVDQHVQLNSELVYMNHSCHPSVKIDTVAYLIVALVDMVDGDEITFFYPSTEWTMSEPFECWCGSNMCLHLISGAAEVPEATMANFYYNNHIGILMTERQSHGDLKEIIA